MTHTNGTGTTEKLLIKRLKVSGLLSFGPTGIDLPMRGLNVLIGANGSGKSNFLEILALLRAAAKGQFGAGGELLWKGEGDQPSAEGTIDVTISNPDQSTALRHILTVFNSGPRLEVADERIEAEGVAKKLYYRYDRGKPVLGPPKSRTNMAGAIHPDRSVLAQVKDPVRYPELASLEKAYAGLRLYRNWHFGPAASLRREQSVHLPNDFLLEDGCENLAHVLDGMLANARPQLDESLKKLYEGIEGIRNQRLSSAIQLFIRESGDRQIRATRLSDGTLRYLCLLAILLHPQPPPLVAIEEPELGLHPDLIPQVADLLRDAATRTQLVVTTHSSMLVDALGDQPESIVICEKYQGESSFERLEGKRMKALLKLDSLGELWSRGQLGGNRW